MCADMNHVVIEKNENSEMINLLSDGKLCVCEKVDGQWIVNESAKEAILQMFASRRATVIRDGQFASYYDKIPLKTAGWLEKDFENAGFRLVPGAIVRLSAYIAPGCVIMPSFINVGAYIGEGSMIDSGATIGSCARIGKRCHISSGVVIAGVLEPVQSRPVIIEDGVFIGANSVVAEGVIIPEGCVLASGSNLTASSKIWDRKSGKAIDVIPAYSVLVPGVHNGIACMQLVKTVDAHTRSQTCLNELLRC